MKSKKLISLLCAAAMTTSAFAGLATTASAAAAPVWSFDGSDTAGWSGTVAPTVATEEGSDDKYLNFLAAIDTKANDTSFTLPAAAQLSDDYVLEYDTNIHTSNGMGRLSQYTQVAFTGDSPVRDTQVYNDAEYLEAAAAVNPDAEHSWNTAEENGWGYVDDIVSSLTSRIELQGKMLINYDGANAPSMNDGDAQIGDSKWVRVRAEVKDGKAKVTIADSNATIVDAQEFNVSASQLNKIMLTFGRADTSLFIPTTPANIKLDNIKVYSGIANAPAFSTEGLRKSAVVATPVPAPEKVAGAAPAYVAPEGAASVYTAGFNGVQTGTLAYVLGQEEAQDPVKVTDGMKVQLGTRSSGEDQKTYASIVKVADGDNALRLSADKFATNGRGPVVSLDDNVDISDMSSGSAVMGFAVYLSKTSLDGAERLFLLDNTDEGHVDGNSVARDVLAVITTEDIQNEDESYKYTAGEKNIGIHVEPEAWHYITVAVSQDAYRVFVDGKYKEENEEGKNALSPALKNDLVGTGEDHKHAVTHLPLFAIENTKSYTEATEDTPASGGTVYSTALIDNVVAYYVQGDLEPNILPSAGEAPIETPAPTEVPKHTATITYAADKATITTTETEAFDGVLIAAKYKADKTLDSIVKMEEVKGISAAAAKEVEIAGLANGDKIMLWNNTKDMIPYGLCTVSGSTVTPPPANTPRPTDTPTDTPATDTPATDTPATDTPATDTPATDTPATDTPATDTPAVKSAVTIDAPAANVTAITVTNGEDNVATGTEVQEGTTLKVAATAAAGYAATVKVTKTGDTATEVTVAADGTFKMPAYPVTVSATAEYNGKFTVTPDATYVNVKDETTSAVNNVGKTPLLVGAAKLSGGKIISSDVKYDDNSTALIFSIDASDYLYKITGAKLKFNATTQGGNNTYFRFWGQFANYIDFANVGADGITGANLETLGGTATQIHDEGNNVWTYGTKKNETSPIEIDITDALKADEDGKMTMYLTTGTGRMTEVADLTVEVTAAETKQYNVVNVTAPAAADGTLTVDKKAVVKDDVVTITPAAAAGKKVTAVKVNGTALTPTTEGEGDDAKTVYKYTVTGEETAIAVTAEFARADATAVEITGPTSVAIADGSAAYSAVVKAGTETVDGTVTWSIAEKDAGTTIADGTEINASTGALTIASAQTAGTIVVTASTKKDVANTEDTAVVTATQEVALVAEAVYSVTKGTTENGSFTINKGEEAAAESLTVTAAETVTVVPTPATGYAVSEVSYTVGGAKTVVNANEGKYTFTGLSGDAVVNVTFAIVDYTITNATSDTNGNSIAIKNGENVVTTAHYNDTITIVPTIASGYMISSITVKDADNGNVAVTNNTFKMPAKNVTVTAVFAEIPSINYLNDFSTANLDDVVTWTAGGKKPSGYSHSQIGRAGTFDITTTAGSLYWAPLAGKANGTYSNASYGIFKNESNITASTGAKPYKISFDVTMTSENTAQDVALEFINSNKNVILGLDLVHTRTNSSSGSNSFKYYAGGKCGFKVCEDATTAGTNAEGYVGDGTKTEFASDSSATFTGTYHVEFSVVPSTGKGTLTITTGSGDTASTLVDGTVVDIDQSVGLSEMYFTAKNWNVTSPQGTITLDNFAIQTITE